MPVGRSMPYRIKRREPVEHATKRVVREELEAACLEATDPRRPLDERVHAIRSRVKKARAALVLVRPAAGRPAAREDRALRDLAHSLARARDTAVTRKTLHALSRRPSPGSRRPASLSVAELERRLTPASAAEDAERDLAAAVQGLTRVRGRTGRWTLKGGGRSARQAFARTYRRARRALRTLRPDDTAARFHEWRKVVKRLAHQVRLLGPVTPELRRSLGGPLLRLSDLLGDLHDLSALEATMEAPPVPARQDESVALVLERLRARSAAARAEALALGARTLTKRPREIRARLAAGWQAWR